MTTKSQKDRTQSGHPTFHRRNSRLGLRTPDRRPRPALRNKGPSRPSTGLRLLVSLGHGRSHIASLDPPHQRASAQRQAYAKIGYPPETRDNLLSIKGCSVSVNLKKCPSRQQGDEHPRQPARRAKIEKQTPRAVFGRSLLLCPIVHKGLSNIASGHLPANLPTLC